MDAANIWAARNLRFSFPGVGNVGLVVRSLPGFVINNLRDYFVVTSAFLIIISFKMAQSSNKAANVSLGDDYDLSKPLSSTSGLRQGLTSYGDAHFSLFLRKVFIKALGYSEDALSRPIIGIINTYSALNPFHANIPQLIEATKRGVQLNGGLAVDFPTISIAESFSSPTSMFLRNLMSMDTKEMIKAQPLDACVMIGGASKNP
jgi:dihydroxy-acid dehydratase